MRVNRFAVIAGYRFDRMPCLYIARLNLTSMSCCRLGCSSASSPLAARQLAVETVYRSTLSERSGALLCTMNLVHTYTIYVLYHSGRKHDERWVFKFMYKRALEPDSRFGDILLGVIIRVRNMSM